MALVKKLSYLLLIFSITYSILSSTGFALPKEKKPPVEPSLQPTPKTAPARPTPLVLDDDELLTPRHSVPTSRPAPSPAPAFRNLGPSRVEQAAVPYVDVRRGIPETPGGNNHMRRQVALSPNGTMHMVYSVYNADSSGIWSTADSAINFRYFYNAYDCGNSNALRNGSLDVPMVDSFPPADPRLRYMNRGGIFIPPGADLPVVYGNQFGTGFGGWAVMKDGAECLGMFSMDTSAAITNATHPVMHPLNESTYVATFRSSNNPIHIGFSYTTDRGKSWSVFANAPTYSLWYNAVDIASNGNTFYIVSVTDQGYPIPCFYPCESPHYLKGIYNPLTGSISFGILTEFGLSELPDFGPNWIDISSLMIGDTLHVLWTDWNNYNGNGFPGPGGHVHHAAVLPDGTVQGPHKVADINIDGRLPDRSYTPLGLALYPWPMVSLSFDSSSNLLFALWSAPPDDGDFGWADYEATQSLACYDIFMAASPNNGRGWTDARNVTQTNNPGCDGSPGNPCHHEDQFEVAAIANDTLWVVAMVQRYPGFQVTARSAGTPPDPGPDTEHYDVFRLYKVPARMGLSVCPILGDVNGDLTLSPADVVELLNCLFLGTPAPCSCDVNCDGSETPADLVSELSAVFLASPLSCP